MHRQGKKKKTYRTQILQMSISRDGENELNYTELKTWRCQYAEMKNAKRNKQNSNTAAANMQRRSKQNKRQNLNTANFNMQKGGKKTEIYRTKKLQMLICIDKESIVDYRELKYFRCQYVETGKAK